PRLRRSACGCAERSVMPVASFDTPVGTATRRLAIVMPVLNEAAGIEQALAALKPRRARDIQVIVVDGGSNDDTVARADGADLVLSAGRGRARQMNAGARHADADVLLFLHADTRLPTDADQHIATELAGGARWGRFDVRIY